MILTKKEQKRVSTTVDEAARLLRENPHWTYKEAIKKARELIK